MQLGLHRASCRGNLIVQPLGSVSPSTRSDLGVFPMISTRTVDITPDLSLMEKLGSVGFAPEEALAEFIDNSIDALYDQETGKKVVLRAAEVEITLSDNRIVILDSSSGIKNFDQCMKSAWSEKRSGESLGQFGLGMKTAAMSLGRRVLIRSKRVGENQEHRTVLDLDDWYSAGKWSIGVDDLPSKPSAHFTEITVEKLHVDPALYLPDLAERLGERFGPLISDSEVVIRINDRKIEPEPIVFLNGRDAALLNAIKESGVTKFEKRKEFSIQVQGYPLKGWIDFLEKRSPSGKFGFHIFRGRRLIQPYVKVGVLDHPNNSNLFGHLYLPYDFPVAFTKNRLDWRAGRFSMRAELDRVCADHRKVATRMAQERVPVVHPKLVQEVTKSLDVLSEAIKDSPLLRGLFDEERKRALESKSTAFGEVDSEVRAPKLKPSSTRPAPTNLRARNPLPERPHQTKNFWFIQVGGFQVKLFHEWIDSDEPRMWYSTYLDDRKPPELHVQTNTAFDAYDATTDKMYYATGNVIMAISRVLDDVLSQRSKSAPDLLALQEELFLRWGRRIRQGVQPG
jgi:histidine kinase/DNA gyrase B/HSP90-like ATPase